MKPCALPRIFTPGVGGLVCLVGLLAAKPALCEPASTIEPAPQHARWANSSALTVRPHRLEGALLGRWAWGIGERVELRSHPLFSVLVPQLEAKVQLWDNGLFHLSSRHKVLSPTPFLRLVAKEGAFGLLPADTHVPWTFLVESALLLTVRAAADNWLTLYAGGVAAVPRAPAVPLLDFPFVYQRFAALSTGATVFAGLAASGSFANTTFGYDFDSQVWALPLPEPGIQLAWENSLALSWLASDTQRLEVSLHAAFAEFPIGARFHWFPSVDYGWAW